MRSLLAVVMGAIRSTFVAAGSAAAFKQFTRYRGRFALLLVLTLPLIVAAYGGKKGGHGGSWG